MDLIGQTAGAIWHFLREEGPVTLTKLSKEIDAPRDVVMQSLGWLARSGRFDGVRGEQMLALLRGEELPRQAAPPPDASQTDVEEAPYADRVEQAGGSVVH